MKNLVLFSMVILSVLYGCKKDDKKVPQITFTYKNMTTLIGKPVSYIKDASPGIYDQEDSETDFLVFTYNDLGDIGDNIVTYSFTDGKCDDIILLNLTQKYSNTEYLINMAEDELGAGAYYYLSFSDSINAAREEDFETHDELWDFIEGNGITIDSINEVSAFYVYNDFLIMAGGIEYEQYFLPYAEITLYEGSKKSTLPRPHVKALIEHALRK